MRFADIRAGVFPEDMDDETKQGLIDKTTPPREPVEQKRPAPNRTAWRAYLKKWKGDKVGAVTGPR